MQRGEMLSASLPRTPPAAAREDREGDRNAAPDDRNAAPDDLWARVRTADDRAAHLHAQLMRERAARAEDQASARLASLGEANRRMDAFLAVAGHELRTPLTSTTIIIQQVRDRFAKQVAQLAASPEAVAEGQEAGGHRSLHNQLASLDKHLARLEQQIDRLHQLVEELLDIATITQSADRELAGRSQIVDLPGILSAASADERLHSPGRPLRLTVHAPGQASVRGDAPLIRRALDQYLRNALKYSPADAPVDVTLQVGDKLARVLVRDRGIGIPEDAQAHIWDRYTQVEGVTHVSGSSVGFGLGLYVCRAIIERHGGQVGMSSTPGEGSTFWFTLPLIEGGDT